MKDKDVEGFTFEEVFVSDDGCGREKELARYFEGRCSSEEEKLFAEHLKGCGPCARTLAAWQAEESAAQNEVLDPVEAKKILEKNRMRLRAVLDVKYPAERPAAAFLRGFKVPAYVHALTLVLLVLLVYPAYRSFVLDREVERMQADLAAERSKAGSADKELRQSYERENRQLKEERIQLTAPALSGSAVYSADLERGGGKKSIDVRFDAQARRVNLVFALPEGDFDSVMMEIQSGTAAVWREEARVDRAVRVVSLYLQAEYFKSGAYTLRISGKSHESTTLAAVYELRITQAD